MEPEAQQEPTDVTPSPVSVRDVDAVSTRTPARPRAAWPTYAFAALLFVGCALFIAFDSASGEDSRFRDWIRAATLRTAFAAQAAPEVAPDVVPTAQPRKVEGPGLRDDAPRPGVDAAPKGQPIAINRVGHVAVPHGFMVFPSTFQTYDGTYDVLIHFHGNPNVVSESVEVAKLNAVLVHINGAGKGGYEQVFGERPGVYEDLLAAIDDGLKTRGVPTPKLRRIALTSWSAGYGAITTILATRKGTDPLDAIGLFDGIHASWQGGNSRSFATNGVVQTSDQLTPELLQARGKASINELQMRAFLGAAKDAVAGKLYFGIAHTQIDPMAYASCTIATDYLLGKLGLTRHPLDPVKDAPPWVMLEAMKTIYDPTHLHQLVPLTEVKEGGLHVIGYEGKTPDHHSLHLFEMSQTLLPEIAARWAL